MYKNSSASCSLCSHSMCFCSYPTGSHQTSSKRSVHALLLMKNDPRLKPEQSCGIIKLMELALPSPIGLRASSSRCVAGNGCVIFKGLYSLMSLYVLAGRFLKICDWREYDGSIMKVLRSIHQNLREVSFALMGSKILGLTTQHLDIFSDNFESYQPFPSSLSTRVRIVSSCSYQQSPNHIPTYWRISFCFVHCRVRWPIPAGLSTP